MFLFEFSITILKLGFLVNDLPLGACALAWTLAESTACGLGLAYLCQMSARLGRGERSFLPNGPGVVVLLLVLIEGMLVLVFVRLKGKVVE